MTTQAGIVNYSLVVMFNVQKLQSLLLKLENDPTD